MSDQDENQMVAAHQHGLRMAVIFRGDVDRAHFYLVERYSTEHEREAFFAGFMGAKRRLNGSKR